ncbi:succinylglutamate desuccinylase/aspartoacylase family protein [Frigidibacter sp. ROC022]|uniref:succinylglutamate desuccinylase/aspartoacylase family protein n=1 Tax=Frigidibacter sp. ROC022 TaxID=2971796 RepID=UPI00215AFEC4|nr:succinylglutamate desuccinylase/aspartoacylase family protein [Frigidibacter sp. ROC022]MCR8725773.1 succinylglutamate desuccinylase/aspartoacylase family protein [Frigidibacter sp. ROC022]
MAEAASRITAEIDFDQQGRQAGYLRAPLSRNTSGWGVIEIPIVVVKNGSGPTLLFTGGIHGDEYEPQIAVSELARTLDPATVQGRVIMLPAVNIPAVMNDTRLSPVDDRDMNRCFPGDPRGTFSEMVAHYLDAVILPMVDASVDLHTAGHSSDAALSTNMHYIADPDGMARTLAAAEAFGAPYNVVFSGVDEGATLTSSVERRGILSLGTEVGGWGRVNIEGVRIARRGLRRFLNFMEVTETGLEEDDDPKTRHMQVSDRANYSFAPAAGLFEPCNLAGDTVRSGDPAGYLHFVEDVDHEPIKVTYKRDGVLWMSAGPGRVARGDTVAVVMNEYTGGRL